MSTTLLAVDDSKTIRKVLEITFASEDYKTLLAANSEEALQLLRVEAPSVALVDAGLGAHSGYDLCQQIKSQAPGTAVLVLSSKQLPYDRNRGSAAGADDFMDKPFDTQQLIDKVNALVKNASAGAVARAPAAVKPAIPSPPPVAVPARTAMSSESSRQPTLSYGTPSEVPPPKPAAARPSASRSHATAPGLAPSPEQPNRIVPSSSRVLGAAATDNGQLAGKLVELGLSSEQVQAVMALSREVVEQVVWEVVPTLAEALIKEEIKRLTSE